MEISSLFVTVVEQENMQEAALMINSLRTAAVLKGLRGEAPSDIPAIEDCLKRLSQLATDFPEIAELDINPLLVFPDASDFRIIDARIRIEKR